MQSARLMVVMARGTEIRVDTTANLCPSSERIVIVAGLNCARAIGQLANRTKMVFSVVVARASDLFSLRIETFCDGIATIPFLRRLWVSGNPHKLLRAGAASFLFLQAFLRLSLLLALLVAVKKLTN